MFFNDRRDQHETSVAESLKDIGERLQQLRLQQNLNLETIAQQTRIPIRHLRAIETGDLDSLPEIIYVRGFIRRYAQALHQDVVAFDLGLPPAPRGLLSSRYQGQSQLTVGALLHKFQYVLYGILIVGVGSGLVYLNNRDLDSTPAKSAVDQPVARQLLP